jgi:hypothetical protein
VGRLDSYLSKFSHWSFGVHPHFCAFDGENTAITRASSRHRALSLSLCLVTLDVFLEVIRTLYPVKAEALIARVQGHPDPFPSKRVHHLMSRMIQFADDSESKKVANLLVTGVDKP